MQLSQVSSLTTVCDGIVKQTASESTHVVYLIQKAEKLLRPEQLSKLKTMVINKLCKV